MDELDPDEEPAQLAFELDAMLEMAAAVFVLQDDTNAIERARRGVRTRHAAAAAARHLTSRSMS